MAYMEVRMYSHTGFEPEYIFFILEDDIVMAIFCYRYTIMEDFYKEFSRYEWQDNY